MTSVTSFMRQVPLSTTYYSASGVAACAYGFQPDGSNYVGNYPPGFMVPATSYNVSASLTLTQAINAAQSGVSNTVLRDMGKTIYAPASTSATAPTVGSTTTPYGYFREVQLLVPTYNNPNGGSGHSLIGGPNGTTFGVGTNPCLTFYIPVTVAGTLGVTSVACTSIYPIAGGQM